MRYSINEKLMFWLCAVVGTTFLLLFFSQQSNAQRVIDGSVEMRGNVGAALNLPINKSQVIEAREDFTNISIGNSEIADVSVLGERTVYVFGRRFGSTSLTLSNADGKVVSVIEIDVTRDVQPIKKQIHTLLPREQIMVRAVGDGVILSGRVTSGAVAANAMSVANRFAPDAVTNLMEVVGSQQIMLAVHFVEMQREATKSLGLNLRGSVGSGLTTGSITAVNTLIDPLPFGLFGVNTLSGGSNLSAFIDALEQKGVVRTLAEPTLVALSGDTADFLAGGEFPIPVGRDNNEITIEFKPFGVALAFTPTLLRGDLINLKLSMEVSETDPNAGIRVLDVEIPGLSVRRANTTVEMRSGQSFAIAGLLSESFRDQVRQVPFLGDLPVLGPLLRSANYQTGQTELVMIVSPTIVQPTTRDRLTTPGFVPPTERQLFLFGQVEGERRIQSILHQDAGIMGKTGHKIK